MPDKREEKIPIDDFRLSSGYCAIETHEGIKRCVFMWNKKRFKDPKEFFRQMRDRGITVTPNVKPGILLVHPMFAEMKAKGMFVKASSSDDPGVGTWWGGKGVFVDFTSQTARNYCSDGFRTESSSPAFLFIPPTRTIR